MNQIVTSYSTTVARYAVPVFGVGAVLTLSGNPVLWLIGILAEIIAFAAWMISSGR